MRKIILLLLLFIIPLSLSFSFEGTTLKITPKKSEIKEKESVKITLSIENLLPNLLGAHIKIGYNEEILSVKSVEEGEFLKEGDVSTFFKFSTEKGLIDISIARLGDSVKEGKGNLCYITFEGKKKGESYLKFILIDLRDSQNQSIEAHGIDGSIVVKKEYEFKDIENHWAQEEIEYLIDLGIIKGYPDKTIRPDNNVTRAEFVTIMVKSLNLEPYFPEKPTFPDVPKSHWAYGFIERSVKEGLVKGYPDGTFKPNRNVLKAEAITVIVNAKKWPIIKPKTPSFFDVPANEWYYPFIETAFQNNIIRKPDYPIVINSRFYPETPATRAELCVFVARMFGGF